jgi:hypothetical protein
MGSVGSVAEPSSWLIAAFCRRSFRRIAVAALVRWYDRLSGQRSSSQQVFCLAWGADSLEQASQLWGSFVGIAFTPPFKLNPFFCLNEFNVKQVEDDLSPQ